MAAVGSASAKTGYGLDPNTLGKRSAELLRYVAICQLLRGIRCAVLNNICLLVAAKIINIHAFRLREEAIAEHRRTVYQDCDTALFLCIEHLCIDIAVFHCARVRYDKAARTGFAADGTHDIAISHMRSVNQRIN